MMMTLLVFKSKIKKFYEHHYQMTRGVLKTLGMFLSLLLLADRFDVVLGLSGTMILLLLSIVSAMMPDVMMTVVLVGYIGIQMMNTSALLAAGFLCIVVVYALLFTKLERGQSVVFLLIPILSVVHISYVVPVVAALFCSPIMVLAIAAGVCFQYYFDAVVSYQVTQSGMPDEEHVMNSLNYLVDYIYSNREFYVTLIGFCVAFLCIYFIRRSKNKNASNIAILVGSVLYLAIELISNIIMDLQISVVSVSIWVVIAMIISYIVQFFRMTLDYHGTTKLQFEDDEYYYYVTAVPKYKVTVEDKVVTRIIKEDEEEIPSDLKAELERAIEEELAEKLNDSAE